MSEASEEFLGVILWYDPDAKRGCLADVAGQPWTFYEKVSGSIRKAGVYEQIEVYKDWTPELTQTVGKRKTRHDIVLFSVVFFQYSDGRDGYKITSIRLAPDYNQEDYEKLMVAVDANDERERVKRMRNERFGAHARSGPRTRSYETPYRGMNES